jgi:transposase
MATTRKMYTAEFKLQAVRMVTDQHLAVAEVARRLGITEGRLHDWFKAFRDRGADAFPGHGRLTPHDEELHRLRAEVHRLKAERDILPLNASIADVLLPPDSSFLSWPGPLVPPIGA